MATYIYNWSLSVIYQFYTADMSILLCIWSSVEACNVYYLLTSSFFFLFAKCYFELLMAVRTIWFPRSIIGPAYSIWELFHAMAGSLLLNVKYLRQFHMKASRIRRVTIYLCLSTAFVFSWANYLGIGLHVERALHDHCSSSQKDWSSSSKDEDPTWTPIITLPLVQIVRAILPKNGMNKVSSRRKVWTQFLQIVQSNL